jgi:L-alanine-DL-glutamate epimerase-like enolase superfamily enzyme
MNAEQSTKLKITEIEIYPFDVRMREPFRIARMVSTVSSNVLVHIITDGGLDGWGEASPLHAIAGETQGTNIAAARDLRPLLIGRNPLEIGPLTHELARFLPHNTTIRGAFDVALHDIAARAAGLPLYRFLGGRRRPLETDITISIGDPAAAGAKAREALEKGFRIIKTKVGTSPAEDLRRIEGIRKAVGPNPVVRVDANAGWRRMDALEALGRMVPLGIEFCEQPVAARDIEGLRLVGEGQPIPIMADESLFSAADALDLVRARAVPYFNIKLSKSAGIREGLAIARIAEAAGIDCMLGCMLETRLGLTAAAHLALACEGVRFLDLDASWEHAEDPILGGISFDKGMIEVPEEPGAGARPDPARLAGIPKV